MQTRHLLMLSPVLVETWAR